MSEPKLISPLLDGFSMGTSMNEHDGIRCCPAIKENTDKKYIVKIISVPASQVQMDALLLAGAYKDPADAMDYYREIGEGIMKEAELLKNLSKLEGFLPYDGWQMEPITRRRLGYEIYLVGSYKRSLDKYVRRNPVTHLEAVNLGLDMCAALSVCRQAGALYVDLKPTNIFVSDKKEYRIGDLGFIEMDALKFTALPDKYHSPYTPPELFDPMASLNLTVDTYAVGMILYQLYNDGQLPFKGNIPEGELPSPVNADYELAEIIMKAIHPDPDQRWNDPAEMGKALASYMQRNSINDIPITPHTPLEVNPEDVVAASKKKEASEPEAALEVARETVAEESVDPDSPEEVSQESSTDIMEEDANLPEEAADDAQPSEQPQDSKEESASAKEDADTLQPREMSEELSKIIAKADDLISHETPEGVVIPEIPEPPDPFAFAKEDSDELDDSDIPLDPVMEDETEKQPKKTKNEKKFADPKYKRWKKQFFSAVVFLLIALITALSLFWCYQNIYLQTINAIKIDGGQDRLTVTIDTDVDDSLLRIICSDSYGNVVTKSVTDGKVVFTNLSPNTMYKIELEIDGFHKLVGQTSDIFTTDATTSISSFTCAAGSEDGSVLLNFAASGEEPEEWTVFYSAEGEEEKSETFTGHSITITGLSLGKVYTFTLSAGEEISLGGETSLEAMATRLILAENLTVTSSGSDDITVRWNTPGDVVVDSWYARCYNDSGYDNAVTVTDTQVLFTGIDFSASYTVEVIAFGMTQPARTSITSNPISITAFDVDDTAADELGITWEYTGNDPEGGWLLMYTIDGCDSKNVVKSTKTSAAISPKIPGAKYAFTLVAADGTSVFSNVHTHTCADAELFNQYSLSADNLTVDLLKTPNTANWRCENISKEYYTETFASGDSISIALRSSASFYLPGAEVDILYVIRDSYGNVLPDLVSEKTVYWRNIWTGGSSQNGELDLPTVPSTAGDYILNIYFDGMAVAELNFTITE